MQLPGWINTLDTRLFLAVNGGHDPVLDFIMYWTSEKFLWIPFYAWLLYLLYRHHHRTTLYLLPVIAGLIAATDQIAYVLKNTTERLRPCHDPVLQPLVHLVNDRCGGQFSFVSSHAANTMALAVFISMLLPRGYKTVRLELFAFVLLNGYSRIYLGAHYPLDIIGGWILGFTAGLVISTAVKTFVKVPDREAHGHA